MLESHFKNEPATLLKKRRQHRCFPVNFAKSPITVNISFYFNFLFWLQFFRSTCCYFNPFTCKITCLLKNKFFYTKFDWFLSQVFFVDKKSLLFSTFGQQLFFIPEIRKLILIFTYFIQIVSVEKWLFLISSI